MLDKRKEKKDNRLARRLVYPSWLLVLISKKRKIKNKGQTVDALALGGEEGRDKLR